MQEHPAADWRRPHCEISYFFLFAGDPFDAFAYQYQKSTAVDIR